MKKEKLIPIKIIREDHDTDWDGVPNRLDCQIFDSKKHSIWLRCPREECGYLFSTLGIDPFGRLREPVEKSRFLRCPKCGFADAPSHPFLRLKGPGFGKKFRVHKNNTR